MRMCCKQHGRTWTTISKMFALGFDGACNLNAIDANSTRCIVREDGNEHIVIRKMLSDAFAVDVASYRNAVRVAVALCEECEHSPMPPRCHLIRELWKYNNEVDLREGEITR
jgi:hypothetical protein